MKNVVNVSVRMGRDVDGFLLCRKQWGGQIDEARRQGIALRYSTLVGGAVHKPCGLRMMMTCQHMHSDR